MMKKEKKILFTANLDTFFLKFLIPQLKRFKEMGYTVHIACKDSGIDIPYCDKKIDIDFPRSLSIKGIIKSFKQMKKVFSENEYELISTHTPFGSAITRFAFKNDFKKKTERAKIVYMAHGFHFYKGASLKNWLIYYTVEKYLAKYTDTIITINLEDYEIARQKFKSNIKYVKGVGLAKEKFELKLNQTDKENLRKDLGINKNDFVIIYAAELLPRKRQLWLIDSLREFLIENKNVKLLLPGNDSMNGKCQKVIEDYNLTNQVKLLGFRKDIPKLLMISDMSVSTSMQEGLPVNIMEAMYMGLPIVLTDCRGNRDLVKNNVNGFVISINDSLEFRKKVEYVYSLPRKEKEKFKENSKKIVNDYLLENVIESIMDCYQYYLK